MLALRPIVVNEQYVALGGNMRYRALSYISEMTPERAFFSRFIELIENMN